MSTDRDVTRIVRSWLEEGATSLPDRVLDGVLDQLPATPQRRAWWPAWRLSEMNNFAKLAIAAAAVVVIAIVGINLLPRSGGVAGPGPTPTPAPSASPAPIASPAVLRDRSVAGRHVRDQQQAGRDSWMLRDGHATVPQHRSRDAAPSGGRAGRRRLGRLASEQNAAPAAARLAVHQRRLALHADPVVTPQALASDGTTIVPDIPGRTDRRGLCDGVGATIDFSTRRRRST